MRADRRAAASWVVVVLWLSAVEGGKGSGGPCEERERGRSEDRTRRPTRDMVPEADSKAMAQDDEDPAVARQLQHPGASPTS